MDHKMKNTVAFVTGGASGIGKAIATRIVNHGGRVCIVDMNPAGEKIAEALGPNATFFSGDVTSDESVKKALNLAVKTFGGINAVINAAGISILEYPCDFAKSETHSLASFAKIMNVNVLGTFNVSTNAAIFMAANDPDKNEQRGVIINLSSVLAYDAPGMFVAYATSKAAIYGMTFPLARSFGPKGIRVVTVAPGMIDTPMTVPSCKEHADLMAPLTVLNQSPKRAGKPDEVAHLMQCIIENPFINGEVLRIDAGFRWVEKS